MNNYFSSIGESLAKNFLSSANHFIEYLHDRCSINSFFFDPVTQPEIEREILSLPYNKAYACGLCSYIHTNILYLTWKHTWLSLVSRCATTK